MTARYKQVSGDRTERVTPVRIPNTEVKHIWADGTARATLWETRSSPGLNQNPEEPNGTSGFFASAAHNSICPTATYAPNGPTGRNVQSISSNSRAPLRMTWPSTFSIPNRAGLFFISNLIPSAMVIQKKKTKTKYLKPIGSRSGCRSTASPVMNGLAGWTNLQQPCTP